MTQEISAGDRVQYSAKWLRSTGTYVGPICFVVGTVQSVKQYVGLRLAKVAWDDDPANPMPVNVENLVDVTRKHLECIE